MLMVNSPSNFTNTFSMTRQADTDDKPKPKRKLVTKTGRNSNAHRPQFVKDRVIKLYNSGTSITSLAAEYKINKSTIHRWLTAAGIVRKSKEQRIAAPNDDIVELYATAEREREQIVKLANAANSPADAYNTFMAENIARQIKQTVECLPVIKNWSDMDKANKIMRQALGLDSGNSKTGIGSRISIDLNIISGKPSANKIVEVSDSYDDE
jgi:hypothetical protein